MAIRNNEAPTNNDELNYLKGDLIKLYHRISDSHWYWAHLLRTKDYGVVSLNAVKDVVSFEDDFLSFFIFTNFKPNDKLHEFEPWYFESISKEDAGTILTNGLFFFKRILIIFNFKRLLLFSWSTKLFS